MSRSSRQVVRTSIAAITAGLMLAGCQGQAASDSELESARAEGSAAAASSQAAASSSASLQSEVEALSKKVEEAEESKGQETSSPHSTTQAVPAPAATAGTTSCSDTVSAGGNTTCSFAQNVASEYWAAGGGSSTLSVYSPVTQQWYTMRCTAGVPTVCRGGNNAVVYIR